MLRCLNPRCRKAGVEGTTFCTNPLCHCLMPEAIVADRYRVETLVGLGGMGAVYRVSDMFETTQVALKVLTSKHLEDEADTAIAVERFRREARYAHQLHHKNIVPVINFGSDSDILYLVMPLITGGTVKALLKDERPLTLFQTRRYLQELASALQAIHNHPLQIVHRDIKPTNLLLHQDDGRLVITDFGIARAMQHDKPLTQLGWSLGTQHYIAPEQEEGHSVPASDIYAMGVVAYQFMTGLLPFQAIVRNRTAELPLPSSLNPQLPASVDEIVLKAIEVEPKNRFQSAAEFAEALNEAFTEAESVIAKTPTLVSQQTPRTTQSDENILIRVITPGNPCAACGRENRVGSRFCRYCRHNLDETSPLLMDACEVGYASKVEQLEEPNADVLLISHGLGVNLAPPPHSFGLFAVAHTLHVKPKKPKQARTEGDAKWLKGPHMLAPARLAVETLADIVLPLMTASRQEATSPASNALNIPITPRPRPPVTIVSQWLHDGVQRANQVIYHCNADFDTEIGSTMAAVLVHNHQLNIASIGDNRIYHFNTQTGLRCLTDSSIFAGEQAGTKGGEENRPHQYLGKDYLAAITVLQQPVEQGDLVVLVTNTLWNALPDERLEKALAIGGHVQTITHLMVETAAKNANDTDVSAIVLRIL